ncbi:hypothetical protein LTR40_010498, partial [Exophiala xenobiotica]
MEPRNAVPPPQSQSQSQSLSQSQSQSTSTFIAADSLKIITGLHTKELPLLSPRKRTSAIVRKDSQGAGSPRLSRLSLCSDNHDSFHSRSTSLAFNYDSLTGAPWRNLAATMARSTTDSAEERETLIREEEGPSPAFTPSRPSEDSVTTASTTSLVLENLNSVFAIKKTIEPLQYRDNDSDPELPRFNDKSYTLAGNRMSKGLRRALWIVSAVAIVGWAVALFAFLAGGRYKHASTLEYDHETPVKSSGKKVSLDEVLSGHWQPRYANIEWTAGPEGEDGLLLEINQPGADYVMVEDIRSRNSSTSANAFKSRSLVKSGWFNVNGQQMWTDDFWVSPDMKHVLIMAKREKVYRHSFLGLYFILNVDTQ